MACTGQIRVMRSLYVLCSLATLAAPVALRAEPLALQRGLNFDIWIDWQSVDHMLATGGFLSPFPDWQKIITDEQLAQVRADGFDFVRLPMDPGPLLALGPGAARAAQISDIRMGTERALAAGLNVVVDLHAFPRPDEPWGTDDVVGRLWPNHLALVAEVGRALNGLPPDRVAFEPLNEPTNDCDAVWGDAPAVWPDMLQDMHQAARAAAPDLPIVLSGACWGGVHGLEMIDPAMIGDQNVIWSFHSYDPFPFSHQGANWTDAPLKYITGLPYPPSALTPEVALQRAAEAALRMEQAEGQADTAAIAATIAQYLAMPDTTVKDEVARAAAWADRHGVPRQRLLLGEFGALRIGFGQEYPVEWQAAFLADKRASAEIHGIAWAVWNWAGDMGVAILDDPSRRMDPRLCTALALAGCSE